MNGGKLRENIKQWYLSSHIIVIFHFFHVGKPPVTFSMFNHVVSALGLPPKPLPGK